jgi:hypothetical protein
LLAGLVGSVAFNAARYINQNLSPILKFLHRIEAVVEKLCRGSVDCSGGPTAVRIVHETRRVVSADADQMIPRVPRIRVRPVVGQIAVGVVAEDLAWVPFGALVRPMSKSPCPGSVKVVHRFGATKIQQIAQTTEPRPILWPHYLRCSFSMVSVKKRVVVHSSQDRTPPPKDEVPLDQTSYAADQPNPDKSGCSALVEWQEF